MKIPKTIVDAIHKNQYSFRSIYFSLYIKTRHIMYISYDVYTTYIIYLSICLPINIERYR